MKKFFIALLLIILAIIIGVSIWLTTLNGDYKVERSIQIRETPEQVFQVVSDFKQWNQWSPWLSTEPETKTNISGNGHEVGDIYSWEGILTGSGEVEHMRMENNKLLVQEIRFLKPFKTSSEIYFRLEESDEGTLLTWGMKGKMPFFFRFMAPKIEPLIAMDYDRGLKMLRDQIEKGDVASRVTLAGVQQFNGLTMIGRKNSCRMELVGPSMKETLYEVGNWLVINRISPEEAISVYHQFNAGSDTCNYTSGFRLLDTNHKFPFTDATIDSIPPCKMVKVIFHGDYQHLSNAWAAGFTYMQHNKLKADPQLSPFEIYLNDPAFFPDPNDWVTEVCIPIK
jgi:effector-binding domain-containing protein